MSAAILFVLSYICLVAAGGKAKMKSECSDVEPLDLAFVVDGASSVCGAAMSSNDSSCGNWDLYRQFIHNFVDKLTIGPDNTRVAVITFSDEGYVQWDFSEYKKKKSLLSAIDSIPYPGGGRNTSGVLRVLLDLFVSSSHNERPDISTTAIVISNGKPTVEFHELASAIIDLEDASVMTYVIGVTKAIPEYLPKFISSTPHELDVTYFLAKEYGALEKARKWLLGKFCNE